MDNYLYWANIGVTPIPYSCCGKDENATCSTPPDYRDGCAEKVYEFLEDSAKVIGGVVIGIIATEVVSIVFLFTNSQHRNGFVCF